MKKILVTMLLMLVVSALVFANGTISRERAIEIALSDAGVSESDTSYIRAHLDRDHGRMIYDVEFYSGSAEYEYEIDGENGVVLKMEMDARYRSEAGGETITEERAVELALEAAGLTRDDVFYLHSEPERRQGRLSFDIRFATESTVYRYRIEADGGRITSAESKQQRSRVGNPNDILSVEEATALVLERIDGATENDMRIRLDYDDGRLIYEGKVWYGGYEYEFELYAETGRFLDWERDRW